MGHRAVGVTATGAFLSDIISALKLLLYNDLLSLMSNTIEFERKKDV